MEIFFKLFAISHYFSHSEQVFYLLKLQQKLKKNSAQWV